LEIRKTESWVLRFPFIHTSRDYDGAQIELIGVTLTSDDGETGTGFTFVTEPGHGRAVQAMIDDVLTPIVLNRDAHELPALWHEMWWATHRLGGGVAALGMAAIDIALWDLRARGFGVPLSKLLGQAQDRVPAYGSGKASPLLSVDELCELSVGYVEEGFGAVKLRVGLEPSHDPGRVAAVRTAIGDDVLIMCDANERLDLTTALWLGHRFADLDVFWFEEPLPVGDVGGHRVLAESLPMAIATGEHFFSLADAVPFVQQRAAEVLQPDVCMVGGISEWLRIRDLGAAHGIPVVPHFMTELHIHLAAASAHVPYVEYFPFMVELLEHPLELDRGAVVVPDRPGHGVSFTDQAWGEYRVS
jgi:L-talarate/galactarate dehydratase